MRGLCVVNNVDKSSVSPAYTEMSAQDSLCLFALPLPLPLPYRSPPNLDGASIRIQRRSSSIERIERLGGGTRGRRLPRIRNLQWHSSCRVPHPEGKIRVEMRGHDKNKQTYCMLRTTISDSESVSPVVGVHYPPRSSSSLAVDSTSDCAVNSGKVFPPLSPEPRSCGPAPARITLGNIHFLERIV